ncbi:MAG: fructokinase [Saprospiraceae bacterium]|nr:MAG: fructokinase [Saprospiraceae bacterium]
MTARRKRSYDILCAGELLIDFISTDFAENLDDVSNFKRLAGGSPANLCMNMSRLGNRTKLVASVGNDDLGQYLYQLVEDTGVDCRQLLKVNVPTSLILVTRSKTVSNFQPYRAADFEINEAQFPANIFEELSLFHTTCFGLSHEPAKSSIMHAARKASASGCQLSIDINYASKIWPDQAEAQALIAAYCALGAIVKVSEVDWERLYNSPLADPTQAVDHFLALGATEVCVTLGDKGCFVANTKERFSLEARKIEVKDTTGAGDAFWSGYLTAWLDGFGPLPCAKAGRNMAELKLGHFGQLPSKVDKSEILKNIL